METRQQKSEQSIVLNSVPVMGYARGRDCLNDNRAKWKHVPYLEMETNTVTKLTLIAKRSKENPQSRFTSLMYLMSKTYLKQCYGELKKRRAAGIDHRTIESYTETEINETIENTVTKMKQNRYRPKPVRRVYIQKANGKKRPLGIPTVIDKTIQQGIAKILTAIYEPAFLPLSYGFRPNRGAHEALKEANHMIMGKKVNWIIDADIEGFFDNVDHDWMQECLSQKISDPKFKRFIHKYLKAGIMEAGIVGPTKKGTPQGGIISPILANIYLHYVLDLWFEVKEKKQYKGYIQLIRYADDFIIGVQHRDEAEKLLRDLEERLGKFGLSLSMEKTSIKEFGRFARENHKRRGERKPGTFDFLGFTHYCSTTRDGRFMVRVKTSRKKMNQSTKQLNEWLKRIRNRVPLSEIWDFIGVKLQGHYNYYGLSGNFPGIKRYYGNAQRLVFKWMNRRSQKRTWNWEQFHQYVAKYPLPKPKLTYVMYNTW